MLGIVLVEPEIPQNTGNIARTCACTGAQLHLVEPMGFRLSQRSYAEVAYGSDALLVFGRESRGLDEALLSARVCQCVRIPMLADRRSLNLSNAVAAAVYEALRQRGFAGLV